MLGEHVNALAASLGDAWSDVYRADTPQANLLQFDQPPATYLYNQCSAVEAPQWDRTVAAWSRSVRAERPRDVGYQRGFPSPNGRAERPMTRVTWCPTRSAVNTVPTSSRRTGR